MSNVVTALCISGRAPSAATKSLVYEKSVSISKAFAEIENEFVGKGYGDFKEAVADAVIAELEPIQARYRQISADKAYLNEVMTKGAERAAKLAARTMSKVRRKVGLAATQL